MTRIRKSFARKKPPPPPPLFYPLRPPPHFPLPQEIEEAWAAYDRGEAGQAGIVNHVSFQVMRRLGISEAFTNDKHYQAAGFTVLF